MSVIFGPAIIDQDATNTAIRAQEVAQTKVKGSPKPLIQSVFLFFSCFFSSLFCVFVICLFFGLDLKRTSEIVLNH